MRYQRNIANLSWYFGYAWPNPSIKTVLSCTKLWCLSVCKKINFFQKHHSLFSWDTAKIKHTCYFQYFTNTLPSSSNIIVSTCRNLSCLAVQKIYFILPFFLEILEKIGILVIFLFWVLWTILTMPTNINSINL